MPIEQNLYKLLSIIPGARQILDAPIDQAKRNSLKLMGVMVAATFLAACSPDTGNEYQEFESGNYLFKPKAKILLPRMEEVNPPLFDIRDLMLYDYSHFETWNKIDGMGNVIELKNFGRARIAYETSDLAILPINSLEEFYYLSGGFSTEDYTGINIKHVNRRTPNSLIGGTVRIPASQLLTVTNLETGGFIALKPTVETFEGYLTNFPVSWQMYVLDEEK